MKLNHYSILSLVCLFLMSCASGGGGSGNDDEITLCTTYEEMDTALDRAAQLWNERHTTPADESQKPPGAWLDFQGIVNHEVGHIVMQGSGDEHLETHGAIMYHTACLSCYRHHLTPDDEALLDEEEEKGDVRTVVYLGVQDDTSICDFEAEWQDNIPKLARVRGRKIQFSRQWCQHNGICWDWHMPEEEPAL